MELVFVLELRDPGAHTFAGARVDYGIGSERYRTVLLDGARICAVRRLPETIEPDCDPIDLRDRTYD